VVKNKASFHRVLDHVRDYIGELRKDRLPIDRVIVFGSHAKGKARRWSDIDVCIISPRFRDRSDAIDYLWKRRREEDVERGIEPVGFHPKDFIDEDPLAWEIQTTGIEIISGHRRKRTGREGGAKRRRRPRKA